jgi:hypothetical protein
MDAVELKAQEYGIKAYEVVEYKTLKLKRRLRGAAYVQLGIDCTAT